MIAQQSTWNLNRAELVRRASDLAGQGLDQDAIVVALQGEFPALPAEAYYANPAAIALMGHIRDRARGHSFSAPRPAQPARLSASGMSAGTLAFAEGQGLICAYCGRQGSAQGDPDGFAWHKDDVPRGFWPPTWRSGLVLACGACKADNGRFRRLAEADVEFI